MKTVKQLLRQPLKTLIGLTLMTLAAAIVCLCLGQALAAHTTKQTLNQRFSTVGIPIVNEDLDGNVTPSSYLLEDEFLAWLERMAQEHPETVKQFARHGILSAYIPELSPLNITQETFSYPTSQEPEPYFMPYTCAMLVITLDEAVITPITKTYLVENLTMDDFESSSDYYEYLYVNPDTEKMTATTGYFIEITGTVTDVVSLADGYRDPVGRIARLTLKLPTKEEAEAINLVPGEQYIVCGMDYMDEYWELIGTLNQNGKYDHLEFEPYDPSLFRYLTEREKWEFAQFAEAFPQFAYRADYIGIYNGIYLNQYEVSQLNAVSLSLNASAKLTEYEQIRDEETGRLLELRPITDVAYTDGDGNPLSAEEYTRRYAIPTIQKLDGSVADFLNSGEGAPWKAALETAQINNQAFAVIGVDRMDYLADFSLRRSYIVKGRDFTEEERTGGSRVCIIHESLAEANGLQVGDTITLNLYETDYGLPYQSFRSEGRGILNPSASFYFDTTPFTETAEYTIVGLWGGWTLWPQLGSISVYGFSPNTVFVPKSSVQTPMEESNSVLFNTIVPQNGKITEFHQLAINSGYAGRFKYNDQDYDTIAANFHNYESLAKQMLIIGVVIYTVLLLLFLLLYPGAQKKNVRTMQSFGAGFICRFGYVMATSLGILIIASLLGGLLGTVLWDRMVLALQTTAESAVALQLEPGVLTMVALAQLIFALILTICVAIFVAAPRGMSARR